MFGIAVAFVCLPLLMTGVSATDEIGEIGDLIPPTFSRRDPSDYTIRRLSLLNGSDSEACHGDPATPCRTVRYALTATGQCTAAGVRCSIHNLILLVSPETYHYNGTIELNNSTNIVISRDPLLPGDVVFTCGVFSDSINHTNLFFLFGDSIALRGLIFTGCGPRSSAITTSMVSGIHFDSCVFR